MESNVCLFSPFFFYMLRDSTSFFSLLGRVPVGLFPCFLSKQLRRSGSVWFLFSVLFFAGCFHAYKCSNPNPDPDPDPDPTFRTVADYKTEMLYILSPSMLSYMLGSARLFALLSLLRLFSSLYLSSDHRK